MNRKILILVLFLAAIAFVYFRRDEIFTPRYLGDLHMHTTCSDGKNTYEEMVQAALKARLNFIAITDHRICPDVIAKCLTETRIICFPGREVTSRIHLLAIGIQKYIDPDLAFSKQVEEIHKAGGIAIAAHPNFKDFLYSDSDLTDSGIDAMECTDNARERRPLPCVYDSDAHNTADVAWQFNSCSTPIKSITDLKNAIISGHCGRATTLPLFGVKNANINY